jgi:hypothetical protein
MFSYQLTSRINGHQWTETYGTSKLPPGYGAFAPWLRADDEVNRIGRGSRMRGYDIRTQPS